jgi:hypothetical protein
LPNGDIFEAVSYKGDIEGWRQQLEQGAKALNEEIGGINLLKGTLIEREILKWKRRYFLQKKLNLNFQERK